MPTVQFTITNQAITWAAQGLPKNDNQTDGEVLRAYVVQILKARVEANLRDKTISDAKPTIDAVVEGVS